MIGSVISHYKILEKLGEGGMGVVYKAEDTQLRRTVALKFLSSETVGDEEVKARLIREAQASASLDHPNICAVHGIHQEDGETFIAMAYIDGPSLADKIKDRPLPVDEALGIAIQIAEGLQEAHEQGVVHRDIKPQNVMLTGKGQAKIMDFGLAQVSGRSKLTKTGTTLGTPAYMSPEQLQGQPTDRRSDVWSFGVLCYEMLAQRLPFEGDYEQAIAYSIVNEAPEPLTSLRSGLPMDFDRILGKALAKTPEERYQHVDEMLVDLRGVAKPSSVDLGRPQQNEPSGSLERKYVYTGAALVLLALVFVAFSTWPASSEQTIDSLAVLPFVNTSGDPDADYLGDGLAESIINSLAPLPNLKVMSFNSVTSFRGERANPAEAGRVLNVEAVLMGRVAPRGDSLFISAELIDVRDSSQIWGEQFNRTPDDIFVIQEQIGREISETLRLRLTGDQEASLGKRFTKNADAYRDYLRGRYFWNKRSAGDLRTAIDYFESAAAKDPTFALGYAGTAQSYALLYNYVGGTASESFPKAEQAARRALEIDSGLADGHAALAYVEGAYRRDWEAAEAGLKRALELNPGDATAHHWYSLYLVARGRNEEALVAIRRAQELDPLSMIVGTFAGQVHYSARRYDAAIDQLKETLKLNSSFGIARIVLALAYIQQSKYDEAIAELEAAQQVWGKHPKVISTLGCAYALSGDRAAAEELLGDLRRQSDDGSFPPSAMVTIYVGLDETELALEWFERAVERPGEDQIWLAANPLFDPLRTDPRFDELVRRMNLEPEAYQ